METIKEKKFLEQKKKIEKEYVQNKPKVNLVPFTSCLNVLKSGKRKGEFCMRECLSGINTCGIHKKSANKLNHQLNNKLNNQVNNQNNKL